MPPCAVRRPVLPPRSDVATPPCLASCSGSASKRGFWQRRPRSPAAGAQTKAAARLGKRELLARCREVCCAMLRSMQRIDSACKAYALKTSRRRRRSASAAQTSRTRPTIPQPERMRLSPCILIPCHHRQLAPNAYILVTSGLGWHALLHALSLPAETNGLTQAPGVDTQDALHSNCHLSLSLSLSWHHSCSRSARGRHQLAHLRAAVLSSARCSTCGKNLPAGRAGQWACPIAAKRQPSRQWLQSWLQPVGSKNLPQLEAHYSIVSLS